MIRATAGTRFDPQHLPRDILGIIRGYLQIVHTGMTIASQQKERQHTILGVIDGRVIKYSREYLSNDCELMLGDVVVAIPEGYLGGRIQGRYIAWDFPKFIRYYDVTGANAYEQPRTIDCRRSSSLCFGNQRTQHYLSVQIPLPHGPTYIPGPCMHDACIKRAEHLIICRSCEATPRLPAEYLGNVGGIDYYRTVHGTYYHPPIYTPEWWHSMLIAVHSGERYYAIPLEHRYPPTVAHGLVTTYHRISPNLRCIFHDPYDLSPIGDFTHIDYGCGTPILDSGTAYYIGGNHNTLATLE